jgi:hypothetical protein
MPNVKWGCLVKLSSSKAADSERKSQTASAWRPVMAERPTFWIHAETIQEVATISQLTQRQPKNPLAFKVGKRMIAPKRKS